MKKICHVTSAHPEEDGRIFRRAAVSTALAGYDTFLIQRGNSYKKQGVNVVGIGMPKKGSRLYRMTAFAKKAYKMALQVDADLYQLHDPELLPFALKLKHKGKAVVFDCHENYVEQTKTKQYLPKCMKLAISKVIEKYTKYIFKRIDAVTFPGDSEYGSPYDGLCERVIATDNFPWLSELYNYYDETIVKEKNSACYVGSLDEGRGIRQMIQACCKGGYTLYLAGVFHSDRFKSDVENMAEYECVKYLGVLNREGIVNLLQKVEIGLCTLLDEGQYYKMTNLPTKAYEYMSMGLPLILNDSEYNKKFLSKRMVGVCINPLDIESYSNALMAITSNEDVRSAYANTGRKAIKEKYCWDQEQHKLLNMYADILKSK